MQEELWPFEGDLALEVFGGGGKRSLQRLFLSDAAMQELILTDGLAFFIFLITATFAFLIFQSPPTMIDSSG